MAKKIQKTLTAALAATISAGVLAVPAMAITNEAKAPLDDLYKAAYEATIKTQDLDKVTQADINAAREAIDAIRGTSVESAVPTFSSIVDKAQQKFLDVAYKSITKAQKTQTQADINAARLNIKELPPEFKNAYSVAIDEVQQIKIDKANEAVDKAIKSQKAEDVKVAQGLLDELKTVVENDTVKNWAIEAEAKLKAATIQLNIVSAEALNNNNLRIVFNRPVDAKSVEKGDFKVTPKGEEYNDLYVEGVKVSEDGMSVDITTVDKFSDKGEYVVNVSGITDAHGNSIVEKASASFKYETSEVKSIEFTTNIVPFKADLKDYVVIKDDLGRDVTEEYKDKLSFTTSNPNLISSNGLVIAPEDTEDGKHTVMVGVQVNDTKIETSKALTISKSAATTLQGYSVVKADFNTNNKTFSQITSEEKLTTVLVDGEKAKLVVGFKDQFGNEMKLDTGFCVVKNYNPQIAIVNNDGTIKANSEGTAHVRIKSGTVEKTITIEVKSAALPSEIKTSKDSYNLVKTNNNGVNIDYTINNQYGNEYTGNSELTFGTVTDDLANSQKLSKVIIKDGQGKDVTDAFEIGEKDNKKVNVKAKDAKKVEQGTYTIVLEKTFTYKGETTTINKEVKLNVVNSEGLGGFRVDVSSEKLDVNIDNKDKAPQQTTITVYELDNKGNEIGKASDVSLKVFDENGKEADGKVDIEGNIIKVKAGSEGIYTVKVNVGTYMVKQITISIADTTPKATTITVNANSANIEHGKSIGDLLTKVGCSIKDQFGNNMKDATLKGIKYSVANASNAKLVTKSGTEINDKHHSLTNKFEFTGDDKLTKGNLDLVIESLTVNDGTVIHFNNPLLIKVTVNKTAKPTETPETEKPSTEGNQSSEENKSEVEVKPEVEENKNVENKPEAEVKPEAQEGAKEELAPETQNEAGVKAEEEVK